MYAFIEAHSFATVVSQHQERPFATHIPLLLNPVDHCLYGHFARSNTQWTDIEQQKLWSFSKALTAISHPPGMVRLPLYLRGIIRLFMSMARSNSCMTIRKSYASYSS